MEDLLEGAFVEVAGGPSMTTGSDGVFDLEIEAGTRTITATLQGFLPGSVTRDITAGEEVYSSIGLEEIDPNADGGSHSRDANGNSDAPSDADPSEHGDLCPTDDSSGCSCGVAGQHGRNGVWLLLAAGLLLRRRSRCLVNGNPAATHEKKR